jgi:xanthine dehydrogenase YagR molybdenum-binding subunit
VDSRNKRKISHTPGKLCRSEGRLVNPLGIKGIGELGNVGMNAAVANAVFHATGVRVRHIPIRLEDLISGPGA